MAFASFCNVRYQGARPLPVPSTTLLRIAELLLAAGAVVTPRALVNLCSSDPTSASVLQLILEQRPDFELNLLEPHDGNPAMTLLDLCLSNSHWTSAAVLLHCNAKPSETSLHRLAATECRECLLYLVGQDRPPTAISATTLQRRRAAFAELVEAGANVAAVDEKGRMVMDVACHNGDAAVMEVLLDSGVKPTRNVVIESIRRCGFDAFRRVLAASGLNSNSGISRNEATECLPRELQVGSHRAVPRTAGDFIASGDRDECLTLAELACIVSETAEYPHEGQAIALHLIERVTSPIRTGLLHIVAAVSDAAVVEALLDKGVPIDARNDAGETALDCAIVATKERGRRLGGGRSVSALLVRLGVPVDQPRLLLEHACDVSDVELVKACIARFCTPGTESTSVLWVAAGPAAEPADVRAQNCLIYRTIRSHRDSRFLTQACCDVALLLIGAGCPISADAFVVVCRRRTIELVRAMLLAGADPNMAASASVSSSHDSDGAADTPMPLEKVCEAHLDLERESLLAAPAQAATSTADTVAQSPPASTKHAHTPASAVIGAPPAVQPVKSDVTAPASDIAMLLLEHGAVVTKRAMFGAIENRSGDVIRALLERRGTIDINGADYLGRTALEVLCGRSSPSSSLFTLLIEHGCTVTLAAFLGACARKVDAGALSLLLDAGGRALLEARVLYPPSVLTSPPNHHQLYKGWELLPQELPTCVAATGSSAAAGQSSVSFKALDTVMLKACIDHSPTATELLLQRGAVPPVELLEYARSHGAE